MRLTSSTTPKRTVAPGKRIKYQVVVRNTLKTAALPADLGFSVQLPAGVVYEGSKVSPRILGGLASGDNKRGAAAPIVDTTANTVTWEELPMPAKARRRFTIYGRVSSTATGSLAFDSWVWQDAVVNNPYCFNHAPPREVRGRL